jgi:hypothetical protein
MRSQCLPQLCFSSVQLEHLQVDANRAKEGLLRIQKH